MKPTAEDVKALIEAANPLLASPEVRRMDNYLQHGRTTCLQHSLAVAYVGLCLRRLFRLPVILFTAGPIPPPPFTTPAAAFL